MDITVRKMVGRVTIPRQNPAVDPASHSWCVELFSCIVRLTKEPVEVLLNPFLTLSDKIPYAGRVKLRKNSSHGGFVLLDKIVKQPS